MSTSFFSYAQEFKFVAMANNENLTKTVKNANYDLYLYDIPLISLDKNLDHSNRKRPTIMPVFPLPLLKGYYRFIQESFPHKSEHYQRLAHQGQKPSSLVIACCDSRAAPETIFSADLGEIFVLRNVANLVPPFKPDDEYHATSAALEYAVQCLEVKNIVILGHGRCGGIENALAQPQKPLSSNDFIGQWMNLLAPAVQQISKQSFMTTAEKHTTLERISIRHSINNLRSFPWIAERELAGNLHLYGAWFDISHGELWVMDPKTGDFKRVNPPPKAGKR